VSHPSSEYPVTPSPVPGRVLVIDDRPDDQSGPLHLAEGATAEAVHPDDVDQDMLEAADLVLVDYDISHWPGRSKVTEIALQPANGMALAAVLREHANKLVRPTGFAIYTGEAKLFSLTPAEPRAHLLARTHNLEWVFVKGKPVVVGPQVVALANAIKQLPEEWPADDRRKIEREVRKLLGLPASDDESTSWVRAAMRDIVQCRPPLSEVVERNHGLLFIRWILSRIIPYPCFLFDTHHLAVRLRITHRSLIATMDTGLGKLLEPAAYRGVLADFLGARWWRAGVESLLWELGGSMAAKRLHARLDDIDGVSVEPLTVSEPVVCIDENYAALDEPCGGDDVVRIMPDDWPSYAGQAWTTVALAREHPRLAAIVTESDLTRLQTTPDE
jgi:hypothetical protein